ncbi:MAG: adenylyltransferase/cytidyltransferase family protein, partial [Anaerolineaceae bacterium]|nr:adenylyltransferase/cytidyltransferase family protein [Anaerolineaceae bacterium]
MTKKVLISGCYDLLHSGHIEFFREAAAYGDLYVALGSDKTIYDLKGRLPINNEIERQFMVRSISYVKEAFISKGSGLLDFETEFRSIQPDYLIVNEDGDLQEKRQLCTELGVDYIILKRQPYDNLPPRSTTAL